MRVIEFLGYLSGFDVFKKQYRKERELLRVIEESKGGPALPIEGGLEVIAKIFASRLMTIYQYPLIMASRVSGIDYVYQRLRNR